MYPETTMQLHTYTRLDVPRQLDLVRRVPGQLGLLQRVARPLDVCARELSRAEPLDAAHLLDLRQRVARGPQARDKGGGLELRNRRPPGQSRGEGREGGARAARSRHDGGRSRHHVVVSPHDGGRSGESRRPIFESRCRHSYGGTEAADEAVGPLDGHPPSVEDRAQDAPCGLDQDEDLLGADGRPELGDLRLEGQLMLRAHLETPRQLELLLCDNRRLRPWGSRGATVSHSDVGGL